MTANPEQTRVGDADEAEKMAFRYGVQVANEEILRSLLEVILVNATSEDARKRMRDDLKEIARMSVIQRLAAANCKPKGIEHRSAEDIIDSVFDLRPN